ncbi:MAG: Eco57I restriction-modification methylase domain-containing protein [Verrucomicrobia bacterium]|nr:Eco57I restriction-modification methylase domain-containing protein [Verrucomicrobiota bacterium]
MPLDFPRARPLLQSCNLPKLFIEELGWEPARQKLSLRAGDTDYAFTAIAEKRGFTAWLCESPSGGLPDHATRLKLDRKLSETSFEHLIVFVNRDRASQSWMWVRREQGKPLAARTHEYHKDQPGDSLLQKLQILYVSLEEEEAGISTVAVAGRARAAFDIERVTKAFYRDFDTHRKAFLKFIDGIGEVADCEWYASVMLNRLMFVYFIQRKGFLDGDHDYLRNRLDRCKKEQGKDKFYTFYRYFLLRLFHEGFGKRRKDRAPDLEKLLGNIPYLNGGLFDVHELEKPERYGKDIQIPDKAFERIFDYFDQYQWHLDERPLRKDDEINPDVLGYIFEKYINQKQMGAYYTKEDITEYISKNTVLPFLFDAARAKCKVAFENPDGPTVWDLLRENPDRYIYPAVRHGADKKLPPEIAAGLDTKKPNLIERRKPWNKPAPADYALPTEIWREVVARRQRYEEVRRKLAAGEVREVNDFITLNLDLRQFAQDVIQNCEGPDLLMALWQAITTITVLDPTGGSGAFIFAALNILEPLYEACLDRMEAFLAEWGEKGRKAHPNYHKKFTDVLARVDAHPNRRYFVLKSIILNNLYAVDIMEEAVEICKLRLFLKLAAQVEADATKDNLGIEPLPDIDFNIRAGNSLVGYATADEVRRCMKTFLGGQMKLMDEDDLASFDRFNRRCADLQQTFDKFRQLQTEGDGSVPAADKLELQKRLKTLEDELNRFLAGEYGVKANDKAAYAKWLKSHQPFHWFIQFYGILNGGGFDVIIGNPPYLEYSKVNDYKVRNYKTEACANLYVFTVERSYAVISPHGRVGMIIPISIACSGAMAALREKVAKATRSVWLSHFSNRPGQLFTGAQNRLTILVTSGRQAQPQQFSTRYHRWDAKNGERDNLFAELRYQELAEDSSMFHGLLPKMGCREAAGALEKIRTGKTVEFFKSRTGKHKVYWVRVPGYFCQFLLDPPMARPEAGGAARIRGEVNDIGFDEKSARHVVHAVLNSSTYYQFFCTYTDTRHINPSDVSEFPLDLTSFSNETKARLTDLSVKLSKGCAAHTSQWRKSGLLIDSIDSKPCKPILDEIDTVLAEHYGFTAEELDFILNYDIKYRLGRSTETDDE